MMPQAEPSESEAYELVLSDNRRFIIQTGDPDAARQNFPVPGETVRVLSIKPLFVRPNLLTVQELAKALAIDCANSPQWRTLRNWARQGLIPRHRIGRKFIRFVEADVRRAMGNFKRAE